MHKIVMKKIGKKPEIEEIDSFPLDVMQGLVGGNIELVRFPSQIDLWLNEDGKCLDLEPNLSNLLPGDVIVGDVFFASMDDDGETVGLTDEQIDLCLKWLSPK